MDRDLLADELPDLALLVRRDGVLLSHLGGRGIDGLRPPPDSAGQSLDAIWPDAVAATIKQLTRRAISIRGTLEAELQHDARHFDVQVTAQSPDRAICVIRASSLIGAGDTGPTSNSGAQSDSSGRSKLDRRGFLRRFKSSMSIAALNERPVAVAIIHVDGLMEISRALDSRISDQVMTAALRRISAAGPPEAASGPAWYMGQLAENVLVVVLESSARELIEPRIQGICASLREPIRLGDAEFQLIPYAGVAVLGRDASSPKSLLEHARSAASEARRGESANACFFSDTLKLRSLARLDVTRELRDAIENRDIRLRYVGRHELRTGRLVALVGYLQWNNPLRGEILPVDFLRIAEATGLSTALSRSILACLQDDFVLFGGQLEPEVRVSFGPLRHHVLSESFLTDIRTMLAHGILSPDRLELRIAERSYVARDVGVWQSLAKLGIRLVVDEFGRQVSSLDRLARVPLWGLQLDRSWVTAVDDDPVASRVCAAVVNVAAGLRLTPIATGIDTTERRDLLAQMGCEQGLGDLYSLPDLAGVSAVPARSPRSTPEAPSRPVSAAATEQAAAGAAASDPIPLPIAR